MLWHLVCLSFVSLLSAHPLSYYNNTPPPNGVAFAFSGAGGRISQLVGLAESLINGTYPNGTQIRPSYFTGISSGAIVTVAMSAVLETVEQNITNGFNFGDLHALLFSLKNSDIYNDNVFKVIDNLSAGYLLDTTPLKNFLSKVLTRINYVTLGDLYIPTTLSTVDQRTGATLRLTSTNPLHSPLSLLDVLLCTTAIPLAFRPGTLPQLSLYSHFLDGATGIDAVPVVPLFDIAGLQTAYVITYNYAITAGIVDTSLPFEAKDDTLLKFALQAFDILRANIAIGAIEILKSSNFTAYVYEPNFTTTFSMIDFGTEETQYNLAKDWADTHDPLPVEAYSLKSTFLPNYTLIDEELAKSPGSHTFYSYSSLLLCVTLFVILSFL